MMADQRRKRVVVSVVLMFTAVGGAGCHSELLASHALSAAAGWLIGRTTTPVETETRCFRNGEEVDCTELPD
jgi:hypothetical protein